MCGICVHSRLSSVFLLHNYIAAYGIVEVPELIETLHRHIEMCLLLMMCQTFHI